MVTTWIPTRGALAPLGKKNVRGRSAEDVFEGFR